MVALFTQNLCDNMKLVSQEKPTALPPWQQQGGDKTPEIVKTPGSPGLSLPRAPNPTVTLLQKARGQ